MDARRPSPRDPTIGVGLSLICPGLGHLYAGKALTFVVFLGLELWLFANGHVWYLLPLHAFQAIAAGGAVKQWNSRNVPMELADVPPPPAAGTARRARSDDAPAAPPGPRRPASEPPDLPPPVPSAATLDADALFVELQTAWSEYRAGAITARQFADRKWRAIRAVRVEGRPEGEALVAAAQELAHAGVLTSEEIGQLAARVTP